MIEERRTRDILLEIVEKYNIPLYVYVNDSDDICIRYDEEYGNSNLIHQLNRFIQ